MICVVCSPQILIYVSEKKCRERDRAAKCAEPKVDHLQDRVGRLIDENATHTPSLDDRGAIWTLKIHSAFLEK